VDADSEGAAGAEEAGGDGVEGGEEVLAGLGFGGGKCGDGWLAVNEDVYIRQTRRAPDDVQHKYCPTDFGFKDGMLTFFAQVFLALFPHHSVPHRD
jgi:hypothetical protein